jgi:hypothetical protein
MGCALAAAWLEQPFSSPWKTETAVDNMTLYSLGSQ